MAVRIGELLLKEKRITPDQLQQALNYQKANGGKLGHNLVRLGLVKDEEITALLSRQYGVPSINLSQFEIDQSVIKLIPADTAQKYEIIPLSRSGWRCRRPGNSAVHPGRARGATGLIRQIRNRGTAGSTARHKFRRRSVPAQPVRQR